MEITKKKEENKESTEQKQFKKCDTKYNNQNEIIVCEICGAVSNKNEKICNNCGVCLTCC